MTDASHVIARFRTRTVPERVALVKKALALECHARVTLATPVDTGRARANWNIGEDVPNLATTPPVRRRGGARRGAVLVSPAAPPALSTRPGVTYWITNNLPYIKRLNDGWSKQAPAGFVPRVVAEIPAQMDALVRRVVPRP